LDDQFKELWIIDPPSNVSNDEYSRNGDEEEAQEQAGAQVSIQEEQPVIATQK